MNDKIWDYLPKNIKNYEKDNLIFTNALAIINTYMNQSDWPHSFEELERTLEPILGEGLRQLYLAEGVINNEDIIWPSFCTEEYKRDIRSFFRTIDPIVYQYYFKRADPFSLFNISTSRQLGKKDRHIVRFVRNDGKTLEIEATNSELKNMASYINEIVDFESTPNE